jgi:uncharacterized protein (DUF488 family)
LLFAIGHSTRPIEKFIALLKAHEIQILADIRTIPKSAHNPQFSQEVLPKCLEEAGIEYRHLKRLGGLRGGFAGYKEYMQTPAFGEALDELQAMGESANVAFMCAEGNPFRCHRLLVADALTQRGLKVGHISSMQPARAHKKLEDRP